MFPTGPRTAGPSLNYITVAARNTLILDVL